MRISALVCVASLASAAARAETAAVLIADAVDVGPALQGRIARAAEVALRELSGFGVTPLGSKASSAPRRSCGADAACLTQVAALVGTAHVLLLGLASPEKNLVVDAYLVDVKLHQLVHRQVIEGKLEEPERAVKSLVEAILPAYAKKGWGGLLIRAGGVLQIKVDGRRVAAPSTDEPLALVSGTHDVDVLFAAGPALLQRQAVREGERTLLEASPSAAAAAMGSAAHGSGDGMLVASYALWGAGTLAIAGAFVAGALSRLQSRGVVACTPTVKDCTDYATAMEQRRQAEIFARNGNILLGVGAGLATAGAGVFVFDLVRTPKH